MTDQNTVKHLKVELGRLWVQWTGLGRDYRAFKIDRDQSGSSLDEELWLSGEGWTTSLGVAKACRRDGKRRWQPILHGSIVLRDAPGSDTFGTFATPGEALVAVKHRWLAQVAARGPLPPDPLRESAAAHPIGHDWLYLETPDTPLRLLMMGGFPVPATPSIAPSPIPHGVIAGLMLSDPDGNHYGYDSLGRLLVVEPPDGDGSGRCATMEDALCLVQQARRELLHDYLTASVGETR